MFHAINALPKRVAILITVFSALALTACSKTEQPKAKTPLAPVGQAPQEPDSASAPRKIVDYMAGLKNIKDESKAVTKEEMLRSSQQVVASAESAKAKASPEPAKPAETKAAAPAPAAAAPAPTPAPPPVASKTAPGDNVVAKAAPTAAAPAPAAVSAATPLTREAPDFPREAIRSGVDAGAVRARLSIDAAGNVTNVQIVEARPARVFDRSVRETLGKWKFNAGTDGRSYETEVEFRR